VIPDAYSSASPSWLSIVTTVTTSGTIAHMRTNVCIRRESMGPRMSPLSLPPHYPLGGGAPPLRGERQRSFYRFFSPSTVPPAR
jgi:hypothetical protein